MGESKARSVRKVAGSQVSSQVNNERNFNKNWDKEAWNGIGFINPDDLFPEEVAPKNSVKLLSQRLKKSRVRGAGRRVS